MTTPEIVGYRRRGCFPMRYYVIERNGARVTLMSTREHGKVFEVDANRLEAAPESMLRDRPIVEAKI